MSVQKRQDTGPKSARRTWTVGDLLAALLITALGLYCIFLQNINESQGTRVLISKGGEQLSSYDLQNDGRINLEQFGIHMVLEIRNGRVRVSSSDCQQQLCVRHGWIDKPMEAIFCLPNNITVEVSGKGAEYDAISR